MKNLRRAVSQIVIIAFSLAALLGIMALLSNEFGDTEGRVLFTTLLVGAESLGVLCLLSAVGTRFSALAIIGFLVSLVPVGLSLTMIWEFADLEDPWWDVFGVSLTWAVTIALVCLLAGLSRHATGKRDLLLWGTIAVTTVAAAMVTYAIVAGENTTAAFWRAFGIVAILATLGTVVLIALRVFRDRSRSADDGVEHPVFSPALEMRITQAAAARGLSAEEFVTIAISEYLGRHEGSRTTDPSAADSAGGETRVDG